MLLRRATVIIERHHPLGRARQISDDETDARNQLAGVPLHFGHDTALLGAVAQSGLIAEAGVETANMVGRATDRSRKQMGNVPLENRVRFEADDVE